MSDYISREAAVKEIDEWIMAFDDNVHKQSQADARLIRKGIANLPAADVAPVVQGRWIDADFCGQYECSECGNNAVDLYDYCPFCGAKMVE